MVEFSTNLLNIDVITKSFKICKNMYYKICQLFFLDVEYKILF